MSSVYVAALAGGDGEVGGMLSAPIARSPIGPAAITSMSIAIALAFTLHH